MTVTARVDDIALADRLATRWNSLAGVSGPSILHCRTGIVSGDKIGTRRFTYLALASAIETVPLDSLFDLAEGQPLKLSEVCARLLNGEIVALVLDKNRSPRPWAVPIEYGVRRQELRLRLVALRFLLRQAGFEELVSDRGVSSRVVSLIRDQWCPAASISLDVSMLLAQGASRQRYVDGNFEPRAVVRLTALARRLHALRVRSNPLLVMG